MEVVLDPGTGHVAVVTPERETGAWFGGADRDAAVDIVVAAMRDAGRPADGWRLTAVQPSGATAYVLEMMVALLRRCPQPVDVVLARHAPQHPTFGWVTARADE